MSNDRKLITVENGNKVEYDVIIEFTSNKNGKHYVAYTNNIKDENDNVKVFIATYEIDKNDESLYVLHPIENQEEINMFNNILEDLRNS